jgi:AAA15 family ATPase/GTPase
MLKKFSVTNFKNFQEKITFNLGDTRNYKFNSECVKDGVVNKAIIYGKNASGKSNLLFAIFDIVSGFTDYQGNALQYHFYQNLLNESTSTAKFEYEFSFDNNSVVYICEKLDHYTFISEQLFINNTLIINRDTSQSTFIINIPELENFDNTLADHNLSVIKYVYKNTKIKEIENNIAKIFVELINFVEKMLFFYSLHERRYIGLKTFTPESIYKRIIDSNRLQDFEQFLNHFDLNYNLVASTDAQGQPTVAIRFPNQIVEFNQLASSGMLALALFYYWYIYIAEIKLLVIDEFDAFYHNKLSEKFVKLLIESDCQVILTTHNTSVMTNELMRPDCYFRINRNGITSLANATDIEIREAHNLEKIYRSGWFDE